MTITRRYPEPLPELPPELAGVDQRLTEAFLAERLMLSSGVVERAMARIPLAKSLFARLARWTGALVLAGCLTGVWLLYEVVFMTPRFLEWSTSELWGYAAGAGAILVALMLSLAAPRLAWWIRCGIRRIKELPPTPLTAEVLAWRVGALALLTGVWFALR